MIELWNKMSSRERLLAVVCSGLILIAFVSFVIVKMFAALEGMDKSINQLESDLINLKHQEMRKQSVEQQFAAVSAEHSSAWTQEEIHDRLRREILRLALYKPYPTNSPAPAAGSTPADFMVQIPRLNMGALKEGGEGYREYQIKFGIPPTSVDNLIRFLGRLQQSGQSLRIDAIEIMRPPEANTVFANIEVTRTVVDNKLEGVPLGPIIGENLARNPGFDEWDETSRQFAEWITENCEVSLMKNAETSESSVLHAQALEANAHVYQTQELESNVVYELLFDAAATGEGNVGISSEDGSPLFDGSQPLENDGQFYRYQMKFSLPQSTSQTTMLRVPDITMGAQGMTLELDNIVLRKTTE